MVVIAIYSWQWLAVLFPVNDDAKKRKDDNRLDCFFFCVDHVHTKHVQTVTPPKVKIFCAI